MSLQFLSAPTVSILILPRLLIMPDAVTEKVVSGVNSVVVKAKEINTNHHVVEKVSNAATGAVKAVKNFEAEHHVGEKVSQAATGAVRKAKEINEEHKGKVRE